MERWCADIWASIAKYIYDIYLHLYIVSIYDMGPPYRNKPHIQEITETFKRYGYVLRFEPDYDHDKRGWNYHIGTSPA